MSTAVLRSQSSGQSGAVDILPRHASRDGVGSVAERAAHQSKSRRSCHRATVHTCAALIGIVVQQQMLYRNHPAAELACQELKKAVDLKEERLAGEQRGETPDSPGVGTDGAEAKDGVSGWLIVGLWWLSLFVSAKKKTLCCFEYLSGHERCSCCTRTGITGRNR